MRKLLFVFGTRPEAVKLCPVIRLLQQDPEFQISVCVTAQHRHLLDQVLAAFEVRPGHDLDLMRPNQTLAETASRMIGGLDPVLKAESPDMAVVQGDTATTLSGALAAFYRRIPVAHVEAGLRTHDVSQPFPEEMNRVLTSRIASLHFAATTGAADNLMREGVPRRLVAVTGNTGIDAVLQVRDGLDQGRLSGKLPPGIDLKKRIVLVTAHRRESFGEPFEEICRALAVLASRPDVQIVYPVHPNPNVRDPVNRLLAPLPNVLLAEPLDYVSFVDLMRRACLIITDSGGIQEEAPSLGKPVLVLRDKTERPEAVEAGTVRLVGTSLDRITAEARNLLDDRQVYDSMARVHNPYGDGRACQRIQAAIHSFFNTNRVS
ncbi:MAG TPA: UDP-N-acetylglucosamine 2-epimerase (non-hydrolyzing) [Bryobacteraceae bacterium]|nr:UDP-N-acetylglucosamine 2-epimerase (non-hydrolyzing) [Bryobacteraceae bacterium]